VSGNDGLMQHSARALSSTLLCECTKSRWAALSILPPRKYLRLEPLAQASYAALMLRRGAGGGQASTASVRRWEVYLLQVIRVVGMSVWINLKCIVRGEAWWPLLLVHGLGDVSRLRPPQSIISRSTNQQKPAGLVASASPPSSRRFKACRMTRGALSHQRRWLVTSGLGPLTPGQEGHAKPAAMLLHNSDVWWSTEELH
jgi:hypothetical protein